MPSGIGIAVIVLLVLIAGLVIYFGGLVGVLIMLGVLIVGVVVLFIVGRKMQRKQEDSESTMREGAQLTSMFVIEKKRCKLKESGLPAIMIEQTPKLLRNSKVSTVRAKVGPKFWTFMCDEKAYALIPEKKEVKCLINGLYIMEVKSARGGLEAPPVKKSFRQKLRDKQEALKKQAEAEEKAKSKKKK